jgi:hypothetical protein
MSNTNFLTEMVGNYYDCIVNIVYKLQKYTDTLLVEVRHRNINTEDELISFLICESENIFKDILYVTSLKILELYEDKYKNFIEKIKSSENRRYYSSREVSVYFQEKIKYIDWDLIHYQSYNSDEEYRTKVYNFQKTFDYYMNKYNFEVSDNNSIEINKNELLKDIEECHDVFSKSMSDLSDLMKKSLSSYSSAVIMNDLIRFMIVIHVCLSKIHVI